MILDTAFVIDVMDGDPDAVRKLRELEQKSVPQIITTPSIFELHAGLEISSQKENEIKKIEETLLNLTIIGLDIRSAEKAGEIDGKLTKGGQKIGPVDSMIAGIALEKGDIVLTRNVKHFSRIQGLKIESY